jgi:hypothetical protein
VCASEEVERCGPRSGWLGDGSPASPARPLCPRPPRHCCHVLARVSSRGRRERVGSMRRKRALIAQVSWASPGFVGLRHTMPRAVIRGSLRTTLQALADLARRDRLPRAQVMSVRMAARTAAQYPLQPVRTQHSAGRVAMLLCSLP